MFRGGVLPLLLLSLGGGGRVAAQRGAQSICDYYAAKKYNGVSNSTTQLQLMQGIVAYAYAGGSTLRDGNKSDTGIFNYGKFRGQDVYLRPWFDGSRAVANSRDEARTQDFLDGGGTEPLVAFLNGSARTTEFPKNSNQAKLFNHWYYVFGNIYSCSGYKQFLETAYEPFNPAYVHKFMDLNHTHIGYFIDQLIAASKFYGFSDDDAKSLQDIMNAKYNVRCLPAQNGQLTSICLAKDCPVAVPSPDCDAYVHVNERGVGGSPSPTSSGSSGGASGGSSSSGLSAGAIAGIAIGGAVVALLAVGMWLFFRRQKKQKAEKASEPSSSQNNAAPSPGYPSPSPGYPSQYHYGSNTNESYYSRAPTDSYIGSTLSSPSPHVTEFKQPEELGTDGHERPHGMASPSQYRPDLAQQQYRPDMAQIAEMESPEPPAGWPKHNNPSASTR
ncbi:hypothetical protein QQS21_009109 [Conoideocrella luteorostrata]|uniref:Uncharacterized protein n=1 Tax=Conoideocrella luteorostrata TaxID=1105319 RepID=A0AAJ0CHJ4_9HYPO|nr:hypothetical protein QQS21_009109 [Conoideocrella luteorostrata]